MQQFSYKDQAAAGSRSTANRDFSGSAATAQFAAVQQTSTLQLSPNNAVAQLNGGWLSAQFWNIISNPYVLTTGVIGAGIIYWLTQRSQGKKTVPPIDQVCRLLNVDKEQLINHLNQEDGGFSAEEAEEFLIAFLEHNGIKNSQLEIHQLGLVPPRLIEGLEGNDNQKMAELFDRFNDYEFNYVGGANSVIGGFIEHKGDCRTLRNMFLEATAAAKISGVKSGDDGNEMLVESGEIHGRSTVGNVLGQTHWFFVDHHWAEHGGTVYDLLFMRKSKPTTYAILGENKYKDVPYLIFENALCFITKENANALLGLGLTGVMGVVIDEDSSSVEDYIDKYR